MKIPVSKATQRAIARSVHRSELEEAEQARASGSADASERIEISLLGEIKRRITSLLNVGVVSVDSENVDAEFELAELIPDIDDAMDEAKALATSHLIYAARCFLKSPTLVRLRVSGEMLTREQVIERLEAREALSIHGETFQSGEPSK